MKKIFKNFIKKWNNKNNDFNSKFWKRIFLNPYLCLMTLLIIIPSIILILYSFVIQSPGDISYKINLKNFIFLFSHFSIIKTLFLSIFYSIIAALIATMIAYPFAYLLAFSKSNLFKNNVVVIITIPIWISTILKVLGLETIFNLIAPNLLGTVISIILGMVYLFLPFAILPIYNSLIKIDHNLIEVSNDLGAKKFKTFLKVILPFSISGIITGSVLIIIEGCTSLIIVKFMGAGKINLISNVIQSYFYKGGSIAISASISVVLILFILIILVFFKFLNFVFIKKGRRISHEEFF